MKQTFSPIQKTFNSSSPSTTYNLPPQSNKFTLTAQTCDLSVQNFTPVTYEQTLYWVKMSHKFWKKFQVCITVSI